MSRLKRAIRYQRRKVLSDKRALGSRYRDTRGLLHQRAASPLTLLAGFGGGLAFGWLCTSRGSARQRVLSAVRLVRPLGLLGGFWAPLVDWWVLKRG
ncbi:MAG: hypothetical protein WCC36_02535 [Gammaproteobacteria bacterium]